MEYRTWKRYAPEGWDPPRPRTGAMQHRPTTYEVFGALLDMAVTRYWRNRQTSALRSVDDVHITEVPA